MVLDPYGRTSLNTFFLKFQALEHLGQNLVVYEENEVVDAERQAQVI